MPLKRTLGPVMLTFYGTGMILGAGTAALLTALSYAEVATMYPVAGAKYIYLRKAFSKHRWIAATIGITVVFAGCASAATVALAFTSYLQH